MAKEVTIKISPDGTDVDIDAEGFVGGSCKDFMKNTIDALGTVVDEKKKPEFFHTEHSGVKVGH